MCNDISNPCHSGLTERMKTALTTRPRRGRSITRNTKTWLTGLWIVSCERLIHKIIVGDISSPSLRLEMRVDRLPSVFDGRGVVFRLPK